MGMYDTIKVHPSFDLPGYPPTAPRDDFQTKDLDRDLLSFYIAADGAFFFKAPHENAITSPGMDPDTRVSVYRTLTIYTSIGSTPYTVGEWFQYTLHFSNNRFTHATRDPTR